MSRYVPDWKASLNVAVRFPWATPEQQKAIVAECAHQRYQGALGERLKETEMRDESRTCGNCMHLEPLYIHDPRFEKAGTCKRGPPTARWVHTEMTAAWPVVSKNEWCGAWERNWEVDID